MALGVFGRKVGMSNIFGEDGKMIPVSIIEYKSCTVLQKKKSDGKDGYNAVLLGFGETKEKHFNKPEGGFFKKTNLPLRKHIKEIRVSSEELSIYPEKGMDIDPSKFLSEGDLVDVTGKSKGRGFTGVIKKHNMKGHPKTRGTHEYRRHAGSIGCNTFPARIIPGKRMPGHYGFENVTVLNLKLVGINKDRGFLFIKGAIPGSTNSVVMVRRSSRNKTLNNT